jgi:hypothetical protein
MVFGLQKLQNDVFCLTEERDYFQSKFLEQVSDIASIREELRVAKKEIAKLREQLMTTSPNNNNNNINNNHGQTTTTSNPNPMIDGEETTTAAAAILSPPRTPKSDASSLTREDDSDDESQMQEDNDDEENEDKDEDNDDSDHEAQDIRQSAEKLLQWASYRSSVATNRTVSSTPDHSSIHSTSDDHPQATDPQPLSPLLDNVPKTIQSSSLDDDDDNGDGDGDYDDDDCQSDQSDQSDYLGSPRTAPRNRAQKLLRKLEEVVTKL